jgi:hypothetical protein
MSPRDIRAAKIAVLIVAVIALVAFGNSYLHSQEAATSQTIDQLSR